MKKLGGDPLGLFGGNKKSETPAVVAPAPAPVAAVAPPAEISSATSNDVANTVVSAGTADPLKKKKPATLSSSLGLNVG